MSDQIQLESGDPLSEDFSDNVPTGKRLTAFLLTIEGTSDTGESLISADLGSLQLELFEDQRFNVPIGFFHHFGREHIGTFEQTTPTNGSTRLALPIPLFYPEEANAIPVTSVKDVRYTLDFDQSALDTVFDQATETPSASLRAVYNDRVPFNYIPSYMRSRLPFSGADTDDLELEKKNLTHVYIREQADNANSDITDQIDIIKDGRNVTGRGVDDDEIQDHSVLTAGVETPQGPWAHQSLMEGSPSDGGYQNNQTTIRITTNNAGDYEIVRMQRLPKSVAR